LQGAALLQQQIVLELPVALVTLGNFAACLAAEDTGAERADANLQKVVRSSLASVPSYLNDKI